MPTDPVRAAPAVRMRGAVVLLDRYPALAGVDLSVSAGEIVLLRGPNGAGKTTLLRTCAGLTRVERGTVDVLGVDVVSDRTAVRRRVGVIAHADGLYDDLTVADNVRFWTAAAGAESGAADAAIRACGLDGRLADVVAARLSAGQRRRTALAILVARRPALWLLDEPHAGLDRAGRDLVDRLIHDACRAGATVLFASHELERAETIATRIVTIAGGLVRDDTHRSRPQGSEPDEHPPGRSPERRAGEQAAGAR